MQLLVSVRAVAEVAAALSGGADIIDAKEPRSGSLGPVSADVLVAILERVPPDHEMSVALGDFTQPDAVRLAIQSLPLAHRETATYLKLGFAGVSHIQIITNLLETAVAASASHPASPRIVAVAYADALLARTAAPVVISRAASAAGATGVLLDTYAKLGGNLLTWIEPEPLADLIAGSRRGGLLTAVAGGLNAKDLGPVVAARPDIVGFRGAACVGGRGGTVNQARVHHLRRRLGPHDSGFIQSTVVPTGPKRVGETPKARANLCWSCLANPVEIND